ncbi:hypothetical protein MC885_020285, partial [Smutsia gigantea]
TQTDRSPSQQPKRKLYFVPCYTSPEQSGLNLLMEVEHLYLAVKDNVCQANVGFPPEKKLIDHEEIRKATLGQQYVEAVWVALINVQQHEPKDCCYGGRAGKLNVSLGEKLSLEPRRAQPKRLTTNPNTS